MPRVLLTGFERFGRHGLNSSGELVRSLAGRSLAGVTPATAVLPVVYGAAVDALGDAVRREAPDVVVALGQADGRAVVAVERRALAASTAQEPDEAGRRGGDVPPAAGGPPAYTSTLPVERLVEELLREGIPAVASDDAGGYVCNHVFYGLMHLLATEHPGTIGGFVHVPVLPEQVEPDGGPALPLGTLARAVEVIVAAAVRDAH